jgi:hypothetical protein
MAWRKKFAATELLELPGIEQVKYPFPMSFAFAVA